MSKTTEVHQKIAKNIQKIRKEKNLSQEDLAYKAGLNRAYIGYIERGERKPTVETIEKIARVLQIDIQDLFDF